MMNVRFLFPILIVFLSACDGFGSGSMQDGGEFMVPSENDEPAEDEEEESEEEPSEEAGSENESENNNNSESPGTETSVTEGPGEDASGEESTGEDASGEESTGEDASGEESTGEDVSGEESTGEDASGEEITGEDASAEEEDVDPAEGCYSGAPQHLCDCEISKSECTGIWSDVCKCDGGDGEEVIDEPELDCAGIHFSEPGLPDGIYTIDPDGVGGKEPFEVYCDMTTDGGGWTLSVVSSDDEQNTWTWNNRHYWDTDTTVFGSVLELKKDFKSPAHHDVLAQDILFIHAPSGIWAAYHSVDSGDVSLADFIGKQPGPVCYGESPAGLPLSAGTLSQSGNLCSTDLFFHARDQDGTSTCAGEENDNTWGPVWSSGNNTGCPFDDPGNFGGLGPNQVWPEYEHSIEDSLDLTGVGFGNTLNLNSGVSGSGENNMRVYVRRAICGNGQKEGDEQCDDGNAVNGDGCSSGCEQEPDPACAELKIFEGTGNSYCLVLDGKFWTDAEDYCVAWGGHLVSITSAEEQAFVDDLAGPVLELDPVSGSDNGGNFWIGLTDAGQEANWSWTDGSPLTFTNWNSCAGEPNWNGSPGVEDYGVQYINKLNEGCPDWRWGDNDLDSPNSFICERPPGGN